MKKVSHRKAPGAMSAMALTVSPVSPSVARELVVGFSAMLVSLIRLAGASDPPLGRRASAVTVGAAHVCASLTPSAGGKRPGKSNVLGGRRPTGAGMNVKNVESQRIWLQ